MGAGRDRVAADAAARGIEVEFVDRTGGELARGGGGDPGHHAGRHREVARREARATAPSCSREIPGDRVISWPKLRALVGVNKLQLPDAGQALDATGYERGTITPLGVDAPPGRSTSTSGSPASASRWAPASTG